MPGYNCLNTHRDGGDRWIVRGDLDIEGTLTLKDGHVFTIDDTYWGDIHVPISITKLGGTKDPTFAKFHDDGAGSQGIFAYDFSNTQEQEVYFSIQLPHHWKEGTDLEPHFHYSNKAEATGIIKWGLEYCLADVGAVFPSTTLIYLEDDVVALTALTHSRASCDPIATTGIHVDAIMNCRAFRPTGVVDEVEAPISLLGFSFHYQIDGFGSSLEHGPK